VERSMAPSSTTLTASLMTPSGRGGRGWRHTGIDQAVHALPVKIRTALLPQLWCLVHASPRQSPQPSTQLHRHAARQVGVTSASAVRRPRTSKDEGEE
jgi:hypothetical protein